MDLGMGPVRNGYSKRYRFDINLASKRYRIDVVMTHSLVPFQDPLQFLTIPRAELSGDSEGGILMSDSKGRVDLGIVEKSES